MGDAKYRFEYDPVAALKNAPKLLGMDLREAGPNRLQGGYYLNGEPHLYRRDKVKVFISRGSVWVHEEGGRTVSLPSWLVEFGGAEGYKDAIRMIKGESQALHWNGEVRKRATGAVKYVDPAALRGAKAYDVAACPLFRWMCGLFGEEKVRKVWDAYCVTANGKHATVFWYLNGRGQICHDKICYYGEDGHRIKTLPMGRQYRIADGYTENPLFGSHLKGEIKGILESEKSCLYAACYYGGVWLGTGGKNNLRNSTGIKLYPDRDAEELWRQRGTCVDWYSDWPGCGDHSDLGDKIEWEILHNRK